MDQLCDNYKYMIIDKEGNLNKSQSQMETD